jgi:uncharacterized Zn finger protein
MARWRTYVPAADRRLRTQRLAREAARRGVVYEPVVVADRGRDIAKTVWGRAWCSNLARYHDYVNRLPRGRTYVRNGSVIDLKLGACTIDALVQGSDLYRVQVRVAKIANARWRALTRACTAEIATMVELLEGRISASVMAVMTEQGAGLFPEPREIEMTCSCPDWATMCKHVAAVMYGVGIRLDRAPHLLFELRGVDPKELVASPSVAALAVSTGADALAGDLEDIFGIELVTDEPKRPPAAVKAAPANAPAKPKTPAKPKAPAKPKVVTSKRPAVMTRSELLARGVPSSTIAGWFSRGVLASAGVPGTYAWTTDLERRVAAALARQADAQGVARSRRASR